MFKFTYKRNEDFYFGFQYFILIMDGLIDIECYVNISQIAREND